MIGEQITIEIAGPNGSGVSRLAAKVANSLRMDGKVVRLYDTTVTVAPLPDPLPKDCHVIIIARNTK